MLAAFGGGGGAGGPFGGAGLGGAGGGDSRPAEERYASQLEQLQVSPAIFVGISDVDYSS